MNLLRYRGFEGSAEIDLDRGICVGKVLFIDDLITYEANEPRSLEKEFKAAIDDYIETCRELGREPKKPHSGVFNVRTSPQNHRELALRAAHNRSSLNAVVNDAIERYLAKPSRDAREVFYGYSIAQSMEERVQAVTGRQVHAVQAHADTVSQPFMLFSDSLLESRH
jgi:predicted HicB family RNase H-like nuclease